MKKLLFPTLACSLFLFACQSESSETKPAGIIPAAEESIQTENIEPVTQPQLIRKEKISEPHVLQALEYCIENDAECLVKEEKFPEKIPALYGINPVFPKIVQAPEVCSIENPRSNNILYFTNGARVYVPANSLVFEDGTPVNTPVQLRYRQFNDEIDVLLSGITMHYDSAGKTQRFETAGMFQIDATSNGRNVKIASGKELVLDMPSADTSGDYSFYTLNTNGRWDYNYTLDKPVELSQLEGRPLLDTVHFAGRFASTGHKFICDAGSEKEWLCPHKHGKRCTRKGAAGLYSMPLMVYRPGKNRLIYLSTRVEKQHPRDGDGRILTFKLRQRRGPSGVFPELNRFYTFPFVAEMNRLDFAFKYKLDKIYNDIRVNYTEGEEYCEIILKHNAGYETIKALVTGGKEGKRKEAMIRRFVRMYRNYEKDLGKKEICFNHILDTRISNAMSRQRGMFRYTRPGIRYMTMRLASFGTMNCDKFRNPPEPLPTFRILARDEHNRQIDIETVQVLDRDTRGNYSYSGNFIVLEKKSTRAVLLIGRNKQVYRVDPSQFPRKGLNIELEVKAQSAKEPENREELVKLVDAGS